MKHGYRNKDSEHREELIRERGFSSLTKYNECLAKRRGFKSYHEYQRSLIEKEDLSYYEYQKNLSIERQKEARRQVLSGIIKESLNKLGKNQSWLASQLNVSRESVSKYVNGVYMPRKDLLANLFSVLNINDINLESLLVE